VGLEGAKAEENAEKEMMDNAGTKRRAGERDEMQTVIPAYNNEGVTGFATGK
jgi:hypothetical protein